ncbi:MAG: hypothetical protein KGP01_01800 [Actinomycetales bacterium]|nr:hypothetical protein [Actinomycetales bacterium]
MTAQPAAERHWQPAWPIDIASILRPLQQGAADPCLRIAARGASQTIWRTLHTPDGPAVVHMRADARGVAITAWGPGRAVAVERAPEHLGAADDPTGFDPETLALAAHSPRLRQAAVALARRWRVPHADGVADVLVASILGQRVTGIEAHRAWGALLRSHGEPAQRYFRDAPAGLMLPPTQQQWRSVPVWSWRRAGVDGARSDTVARCLGALAGLPLESTSAEEVRQRLRAVPGYGIWTDALLATRSYGDADAVAYRDFHLCHSVCHALTGSVRGSDELMRELLEPWVGHRYRVVRLVEMCGISAPRRGPRLAPSDNRRR